jgi:hypothetical protein
MSTQIMISLLRKGETGDQILKILDEITTEESDQDQTTLEF